jgi:hypothetical protein
MVDTLLAEKSKSEHFRHLWQMLQISLYRPSNARTHTRTRGRNA